MKKLIPTFEEYLNEMKHTDATPSNVAEIIKLLVPGARFENKKGEVFKILSDEKGQIEFVALDFKGNDTDRKRVFGNKVLAQMMKNREFFITNKHRRDV